MNLTTENVVSGGDTASNSATRLHRVGTRMVTRDGRVFRYALVGAADLVAGNVIQGPATIANHLANTPPAVAIGATSFTYTPGATAAAANFYRDGWLQVDTTPGNGETYGVESHLAISSSTAFTLNLASDDPIRVALTTSSRVGLIPNPYRGVIQLPVTTATGIICGVAPAVITAAQFGWLQTWGIYAGVLTTGTPALGASVMGPGTVAGAAQVVVAAGTLIVAQWIGQMAQVGVDGKNNAVFLKIAP